MSDVRAAFGHFVGGRYREAAAAAVARLQVDARDVDALRVLGMSLDALGHGDDALGALDRALALDRRNPATHANRGQVLRGLGRLPEAAEALRRAVAGGLADAGTELGHVEAALRRPLEAARAFAENVGGRAGAVAFVDHLAGMDVAPSPDLVPALLAIYPRDDVDATLVDHVARQLLDGLRARGDLAGLAASPVARAWLAFGTVHHPGWEEVFVRVREHVARHPGPLPARPDGLPGAREAFALQGWTNQYAWGGAPPEGAPAEVRAMYGPPDRGLWPSLDRAAHDRPAREAAAEVPALGGTDDPLVQAMYEADPYPRHVGLQVRAPVPFARWLRHTLPGAFAGAPPPVPAGAVDVLVAGCGTGRHALQSATSWAGHVTAVDLSRASLRRAVVRAAELSIRSVDFFHADLRTLADGPLRARFPEGFHVVESVGVLHHLPDPAEGLAVLRRLLRPDGWMRLGLYAERARADVAAARALVAERGFRDDPDGIRAARAALLALPADHPAAGVVRSADFASVSGTRDLVFHVRETAYTPTSLAALLAGAGLRFEGFQFVDPRVPLRYDQLPGAPDAARADLARWDAVERAHPRSFAGMYVFWARPEPR